MKSKGFSTVFVFGLVAALFAAPAWGQGKRRGEKVSYSHVIAKAECMVDGDDILVTAMLEQSADSGPGTYDVGGVAFVLEEWGRGKRRFQEITDSWAKMPVYLSFPEVAEGERVEVATHLYEDVCSTLKIDPSASALRAVVQIEVLNADPNRKGGLIHTGRCTSFPNPCRK